jgi:CAAX protease family protein
MLSVKPWKAEAIIRLILSLIVCFCAGSLAVAIMQHGKAGRALSVGQMIVAALSFQGAVLVLVTRFLREHGTTWKEGFGLAEQWPRAILFGFICASLFLPLGWGLQWLSAQAMLHFPKLHLKPEEQQAVQTLQMAVTWGHRLVLGIITMLLAPVAEEVLFRGILYPWLKQAGFPRLALWGTTILFAAIHFNLATFIPLAALALVLALLYDRMDNLLAPITAHALFNGVNFAMLYSLQDQLLQSP